MYSSEEQTLQAYNVSTTTSGFTGSEISVSTDVVSYNGSTVHSGSNTYNESTAYSDFNAYNESTAYSGFNNNTNITVLLSSAHKAFVTGSSVSSGSSEVITGVAVTSITCIVILMIVVPLIIWRCRVTRKQVTFSAAVRLVPDKYGTFSYTLRTCFSDSQKFPRISCIH